MGIQYVVRQHPVEEYIDGYFNEWNDYFNLSEEYFGYTAFDEIAPGLSDFSGVSKSDTSDCTKL